MSPQRFDPKKSQFSLPQLPIEEISPESLDQARRGYESRLKKVCQEGIQLPPGAFEPKDIFSNQRGLILPPKELPPPR